MDQVEKFETRGTILRATLMFIWLQYETKKRLLFLTRSHISLVYFENFIYKITDTSNTHDTYKEDIVLSFEKSYQLKSKSHTTHTQNKIWDIQFPI